MIKFRQKQYTMYDETDSLKRMKDSDILAQRQRSNTAITVKDIATGATGAAAGAAIGGLAGAFRKGSTAKGGALMGAAIGGLGSLAAARLGSRKQRQENDFYNDRLEYAQRHAKRRERADWRNNNLNRDGYTY